MKAKHVIFLAGVGCCGWVAVFAVVALALMALGFVAPTAPPPWVRDSALVGLLASIFGLIWILAEDLL